MRNTFVKFLMEKTSKGDADKAVLLTGDLGYSVMEPLAEAWKDRFLNVGIAEALMTSMAAAIADQGYKVFTYSITPFATFRCLEQIRNDVCYHNLDVSIVGVGAGYGYGSLGATHHATEDLAAMWAIHNMKVFNPADCNEAVLCYQKAWDMDGPTYLRIGKGGEGILANQQFQPLETNPVLEYFPGKDITLISTGNILSEVLKAREVLRKDGINAQVISCPILKPFPAEEIINQVAADKIVFVEEVAEYGGFSSFISKKFLELGRADGKIFKYFSTRNQFANIVGDIKLQRQLNNLDGKAIVQKVKNLINY